MVGFNNEHFDYPVLHMIYGAVRSRGRADAPDIYEKAMAVIKADRNDMSHRVWESDRVVPQVDLFKIMHFDNFSRSTSLKKLQMAMRSVTVEDLPFPPGTILTHEQMDITTRYMCHDISETLAFARNIEGNITFRDELGPEFTNYNDTKIGKQHFIGELEREGVVCFERRNGRRVPRQTMRSGGIRVADRLIDVPFTTPDLQRMLDFFRGAVIPPEKTKGFFTDLTARLGDFKMVFGAGGIHGSIHNRTLRSNDTHMILDVDVTSYYPSLAIVNGWFPEHLGEHFCKIYANLKTQRTSYPKGTPENAMLKLALNGVYGDSNNVYSPFYDPAYTMAITINGQLLLAWLAEMIVLHVPDAELIQINTDGLTVRLNRSSEDALTQVCRYWQDCTRLDLEQVEYDLMAVRDVNNYIARPVDGKVKRKNAYLTNPEWHQNHSSLVVPKAVSAFVLEGHSIVDFIFNHPDPFDFMRHVKVPRSSRLEWGGTQVQNTSRYYIALAGKNLVKIMPPDARNPDADRRIGVDVGWNVQMCNNANDFDWTNLNRRFYVDEAKKLVTGLGLSVTCN